MKALFLLSIIALLGFVNSLDSATAAQLLQLHNIERRKIGLADLSWDKDLENGSERWASTMASSGFRHSKTKGVGENIAKASFRDEIVPFLFNLWAKEKKDFSNAYPYPRCGVGSGEVGHYTQIMWSKTTKVGCGLADGNGSTNLVCQYSLAGNYIGNYVWTSDDIVNTPGSMPPGATIPADNSGDSGNSGDTGSSDTQTPADSSPSDNSGDSNDSGDDNNDNTSSYTPRKNSRSGRPKTNLRTTYSSSSSSSN